MSTTASAGLETEPNTVQQLYRKVGDLRFDGDIERPRVWLLPNRRILRLHILQHFERCPPFSGDPAAADKGENAYQNQGVKSTGKSLLSPVHKDLLCVVC